MVVEVEVVQDTLIHLRLTLYHQVLVLQIQVEEVVVIIVVLLQMGVKV